MSGPTRVAAIYGSMVTFVYLATDGFQNNAPFVFTLPVAGLGVLTLFTKIPRRKRLFTSLSFFVLAASLYHWSRYPHKLERSALLISAAHVLYMLSFVRALNRWWKGLAVLTAFVMGCFLYFIFADLFRSLPMPIVMFSLMISVVSASFIAAGSVWKHGSKIAYAETTAMLRWFGLFLMLVCHSSLLINHFAAHHKTLVWLLNLSYYGSQYLLYYANERAF
jgi:hypothetical protein